VATTWGVAVPMMRRRGMLLGAAAVLFGAATASRAQDPGRVWKLGMLLPGTRPAGAPDPVSAAGLIAEAMGDLGFVEGKNLIVDRRYAEAQLDHLPAIARELVGAGPDAIVAVSATATRAAKQATATIPIVFYGNFDPVASGTVTNLARPGGNVTGILIARRAPWRGRRSSSCWKRRRRRGASCFLAPPDPAIRHQFDEARKAASRHGVDVVAVEVGSGDYDRAFAAIARERPQALFVAATRASRATGGR